MKRRYIQPIHIASVSQLVKKSSDTLPNFSNHGPVEESLGFKVADVAKDYGCVVEDIPDAIAALTDQKFPVSDCIIIKG